jgi:tetratricopeptide (TPR) repeat protein
MDARPKGRILAITESVEELPMNLGRWLLLLGAIIVLRHFLEQVSGQQKTLYFLSYFIHYPLAYIAPILTLSVVLALLARERIERVTRLMLFAWLLTLLPPLIDLVFARVRENPELIGYLIPKGDSLWPAFLNLLNPAYREFQGTTAGIRIEAAVGCLLGATYVYLKTRSIARSIVSLFVIYTTMFFFFALPVVTVSVSRIFGADVANVYQLFFARADVHRAFVNATPFGLSDLSNSLIDLFVIAPVVAVWLRLYDRRRVALLGSLIDPVQIPFHVLLTFAGTVLGAKLLMGSTGLLSISHAFDAYSIIGILAASFFTGVTAVALRRIHGDGPASPEAGINQTAPESGGNHAPSWQTATPPGGNQALVELAVGAFTLASLLALSVSYVALTHVLAILSVYYLYYAWPIRLSRFAPLAGFMIGGTTVFSILLGYAAYAGGAAALWLPRSILLIALLVPTLAFTARDVWARAAVRGESRFSLAAVLGEGRTRRLAAVAVLIAALIPAVALRMPLLAIPGAIVGVLGFLAVMKVGDAKLPGALGVLAAAFAVVALLMNATGADILRVELGETSFAETTRRASTFEMIDPDAAPEVQTHIQEGLTQYRRGDYEGAAESFRRALEVDPDHVQSYVSIGSVYLRLDRLAEAARAFRKAISLDPENAAAHVGLGQAYKLYSEPDNAIAELEKALELDPENSDAAYTLALIHMDLGNLEEEFEALHTTISLDPRNSLAQSRLADILLANGEFDAAIRALRGSLTGRTPVDLVHTRLAEAHYALGNLETAEEELRKEVIFKPKSPSAHASLGRLLAELGRTDEARREFSRALELTEDERLRNFIKQEIEALGS